MEQMDIDSADLDNTDKLTNKVRSISRSRSRGYKREVSVSDQKLEGIKWKSQKSTFKNIVNVNEADRLIQCKMPKHMFTGKATFKRDRR